MRCFGKGGKGGEKGFKSEIESLLKDGMEHTATPHSHVDRTKEWVEEFEREDKKKVFWDELIKMIGSERKVKKSKSGHKDDFLFLSLISQLKF